MAHFNIQYKRSSVDIINLFILDETYAYLDRDIGSLLSFYGTAYYLSQFVASERHLVVVYKQCSGKYFRF